MNDDMPRDPTLSRAYRETAQTEPPPALDALILAVARKEAAVRPQATRLPWWRRAMMPVGVFATLVVTLSVVLMVEQEQREPEPAPAAVPASSSAADRAAKATATKPTARRKASSPEAASQSAPRQDYVRPATKAAGAPMLDGATAPAAMAPAPVRSETSELDESERMAQPHRAAKTAGKKEAVKAPKTWIDEIRQLRRAGAEAEAQAQLAAFRRAYPDYPLPDDLKRP